MRNSGTSSGSWMTGLEQQRQVYAKNMALQQVWTNGIIAPIVERRCANNMKKVKVYLDTNMVLDVFINHARALKRKERVLLPKKYEFMLANKEKVEFVTSFLTKAEIVRELLSAHGIEYEKINEIWIDMLDALSCFYVNKFEFDEKLVEIASKMPLKLRTLFNFMHMFVAMNLGCLIVSGDDSFIEKIRSSFLYDKAVNYIELRKLVEGEV